MVSHNKNLMPSGKELFLRSLPAMACLAVMMINLVVRPGVFWGTTLLVVMVVLMFFAVLVWLPKFRSL